MASFAVVLLTVSLLVATSSAAPKNTKLSIKIPEGCKGGGFCSIKPEGYDEYMEKINKLLPPVLMNVGSRAGTGILHKSDTEDNCPSYIQEEPPAYLYVHTDDSEKMDIVVQTKLIPQTLVKVRCLRNYSESSSVEGSPQCFSKLGLDGFVKSLTCKETMANRTLLVFDPYLGTPVTRHYPIPVCCSCHITSKV